MAKQQKSGKTGRNKNKCAKYTGEGMRWRNARRRVRKQIKRATDKQGVCHDKVAVAALARLESVVPKDYVRK